RGMDAALLGARELITPIIAMTITLAAVYTPIGLQGGLTGSLFREFALTLAGAVFISGIVALTLSPMICSKLLHRGEADHGFSGLINRNFDRFRNAYGRVLDRTLQVRPAVYVVWVGLALLTIPMFKQSTHELAPTEDQGVIFGFIDSPANATLDQLQPFADAAGKVFHGFPETNFSFQITSPDESFAGMVLKPWGVRTKPTKAFVGPVMMGLMQIPGIEMFPLMPPALPGGGFMPVEFYICSMAEVQRIDRLNADQLSNMYVTGPNNQLVPLSTIATIQNRTVPRSLNRMQQLNAVRIMGVPTGGLDAALKFLENEAATMLPKGYIID